MSERVDHFAFHQKGVTETFFFFTLGPGDMQLSGDNLYVDLLCRPAADNAIAFFNALAEFAYDMETQPCLMYFSFCIIYIYMYMQLKIVDGVCRQDSQQVKAQMPSGILYPEIYDEARSLEVVQ